MRARPLHAPAQGPMLASARRRVLKATAVYGSLPAFGRNVGRAISPALQHKAHGRQNREQRAAAHPKSLPCKGRCRRRRRRGAAPGPANTLPGCCALPAAAPPAKRGARPCRTLRDISAASRQCTPPSAPSGASSSPCRGAFLGGCPRKSLPCKGRCRRRRRRGAAPGPANTLPGCCALPAAAHSCVGADACIGPPSGLKNGGCLRITARFRPQCRAGNLARRGALWIHRLCGMAFCISRLCPRRRMPPRRA